MALSLDATDRWLLQIAQTEFPLIARPFAELGARVGIDEEQALSRMGGLKGRAGPIRQISAIFDSHLLGYASTLAAGQYRAEPLEAAASVVCQHPGVSHCYQRDHRYNLWYTLAVPPTSRLGLDGTIARLHELSGAAVTRSLPALQVFKIGVKFDVTGEEEPAPGPRAAASSGNDQRAATPGAIAAEDIPIIRALQEDLLIEARPFDQPAAAAGCSVDDLLTAARRMLERRQMRRYAAVLRHHQVGYVANCMVCWRVPNQRVEEIGRLMAGFDAVSHCYRRPTYDDWPFNVYTMIHGRGREDCVTVVEAIASATGIPEREMLWSVREFKKTRVRYFTPETEAWDKEHAP